MSLNRGVCNQLILIHFRMAFKTNICSGTAAQLKISPRTINVYARKWGKFYSLLLQWQFSNKKLINLWYLMHT